MSRRAGAVAVASILLATVTSAAAMTTARTAVGTDVSLQCPARLASDQSAVAPGGWTAARSAKDGPLEAIAFYDGAPADQVELAPTGERREGDWLSSEWTFEGNAKPVQIACRYRGTNVVLTRPLRSTIRQCTLRMRRGAALIDPTALRCR